MCARVFVCQRVSERERVPRGNGPPSVNILLVTVLLAVITQWARCSPSSTCLAGVSICNPSPSAFDASEEHPFTHQHF